MNFIPCLAWVPKGKAKSCPDKLQLSPEELKRIIEETETLSESDAGEVSDDKDTSDADEVNEEDENYNKSDDDFDAKYDLDGYDDDDDDKPFMKIADIAAFVDNKDDNYITDYSAVDKDDEEENDNFIIKDTDNLLVVGHVENDCSILEVFVYNQEEDSLYVHHDIVLPSYPLALEWLDFDPSEDKPGNFVAVADMTPVIKIYDLDVVEVLEPDFCLGKESKQKSSKKKSKYHSDAVLSLSWNKDIRNLLASGSADSTIIIWDLREGAVLHKLDFHTNKVQSLQWHPFESSFLLSGCTDGLLKVFDCRSPDIECKAWCVDGEVEKVLWNSLDSMKFMCSTDKGFVHSLDLRKDAIEQSVQVSEESVTGLDMNPTHPEILITASMDKMVKVWNVQKAELIKSYKLKVGSIYTAKFAPDCNSILALGGNDRSQNLKVMEVATKVEDHVEEEVKHENIEFIKRENSNDEGIKQKKKKFKKSQGGEQVHDSESTKFKYQEQSTAFSYAKPKKCHIDNLQRNRKENYSGKKAGNSGPSKNTKNNVQKSESHERFRSDIESTSTIKSNPKRSHIKYTD